MSTDELFLIDKLEALFHCLKTFVNRNQFFCLKSEVHYLCHLFGGLGVMFQ